MNKVLSQAIRKAVSEYSPKNIENIPDKRPDLFSLSNETAKSILSNLSPKLEGIFDPIPSKIILD